MSHISGKSPNTAPTLANMKAWPVAAIAAVLSLGLTSCTIQVDSRLVVPHAPTIMAAAIDTPAMVLRRSPGAKIARNNCVARRGGVRLRSASQRMGHSLGHWVQLEIEKLNPMDFHIAIHVKSFFPLQDYHMGH